MELSKLLEDLLENPETGKKLKALLGDGEKEEKPLLPEGLDPQMLMKITKAMSVMGSAREDSRARLLYDLKPYISVGRRERVDEAVKILGLLKVIDIMGKDGDYEN